MEDCEKEVVHRMNKGHTAQEALICVLSNRIFGIYAGNAKKCSCNSTNGVVWGQGPGEREVPRAFRK